MKFDRRKVERSRHTAETVDFDRSGTGLVTDAVDG
jgi:hypothetical protein